MSERIHAFGENGELSDGAELALDHFLTTKVNPAISDAVSQVSGGTTDHTALTNRDAADQHPIGAITNLWTTLAGKAETSHTHTPASIGAAPASHTHGATDLTGVVKTVNGEAPDSAGDVAVESGGGWVPRFGTVPVLGPTTRIQGGTNARAWVPLNPPSATLVTSAQIGHVAGELSGLPLSLPRPVDYKSHAIQVATAEDGATLRWGLYGVDADGMPTGTPVLDSGSIALDATGHIITMQSGTVPAGDYWLLAVVSSLDTARVRGWTMPWQMSIQGTSPTGTGFAFKFDTATTDSPLPDVSSKGSLRLNFGGRGAVAVMIGGAP